MVKKQLEWQDKFRVWLEKEGYTELVNHFGIDELIKYVDMGLLMPLKAELMKDRVVN